MLSSISFLFDTYWALGMTLFPSIPFWSPHSAVMTLIAVAAVSFLAGKIAGTFCGGPSANPLDPVADIEQSRRRCLGRRFLHHITRAPGSAGHCHRHACHGAAP